MAADKKMITSVLFVIILIGMFCSVLISSLKVTMAADNQSSSPNGDSNSWPMFRHDPAHSGFSASTATSSNQSQWQFATLGSVQSAPAIVNGLLFVGSNDWRMYALNASSGVEAWSYRTDNEVTSSPAVVNGTVYVGSLDGSVYALNATTGFKIWSRQIGSYVHSSPTVVAGVVYVASVDGTMYALNAVTGSLVWNSSLEGDGIASSAAVVDDGVYVGSEYAVFAFNASTGETIWSYETGKTVDSSPAVYGGVVYVGCYDDNVYALNATTGSPVWSYHTNGSVNSSPAVAGDVVYIGSEDDYVYALNATTGSKIWSQETGGPITVSPALANGVVYIGSTDGNLYVLNATTGNKMRSYQIGSPTSAAVANGMVYVGSLNGNVYSFCTFGSLTSMKCNPDPAFAGNVVACTAVISGDNPTGHVTWESNCSSGSFSSDLTFLIAGTCSTTYIDTKPGVVAITALYSGDADNAASNETLTLDVLNSTLPTTISIVQSSTRNNTIAVDIGDKFNVDVRIDQAIGLWGYNLDVHWTPTVIRLENVTEGPFLEQGGNTLFIVPKIDNEGGSIVGDINDVLLMSNSVVNGSGVLVTLTFQAVGMGRANITVNPSASELVGPPVYALVPPFGLPGYTFSQLSFVVSNASVSVSSPVDFYHDGVVNFNDVVYFAGAYIQYNEYGILNPACDLNHDGKINFEDIALFVADYQAAAEYS